MVRQVIWINLLPLLCSLNLWWWLHVRSHRSRPLCGEKATSTAALLLFALTRNGPTLPFSAFQFTTYSRKQTLSEIIWSEYVSIACVTAERVLLFLSLVFSSTCLTFHLFSFFYIFATQAADRWRKTRPDAAAGPGTGHSHAKGRKNWPPS